MFCKNCGTSLPDSARFCPKCGLEVKQKEPQENLKSVSQQANFPISRNNTPDSVIPKPSKSNTPDPVVLKPSKSNTSDLVVQKKPLPKNNFILIACLTLLVLGGVVFTMIWMNLKMKESEKQSVLSTQIEDKGDQNDSINNTDKTEEENGVINSGIHNYKFISGDFSFEEASERARDLGGYLVSIDSEEEFNTITNLAREQRNNGSRILQYYIGARRAANQSSYYYTNVDGNITDKDVNSVFGTWFWGENEPSFKDINSGDEETILSIMYLEDPDKWVGNDVVDDIAAHFSEFSGRVGCIVEIE